MMLCRFFDCHLINVGKHLWKMKGKREQGEQGETPAHGASIRCAAGRSGRNRRDGRGRCRWPQEGHDLRGARPRLQCRALAQVMNMYAQEERAAAR